MPAAPETQFQAAGINTNTYTPVKGGDLGGSHLFGGSGQIWAGIGQTALDAAKQFQSTSQMIQASPLNPNVRAQQEYQGEQADYGADVIQNARDSGQLGMIRSRATPSGAEVLAPAETGTAFAPLYMPKVTPPPGKEPPPPPTTAPGTGKEGQEKTKDGDKKENLDPPAATTSAAPAVQPDLSAGLASTLVPSHGGSTAAATAGGDGQLNTGQPQSSDVIATPAAKPSGSIWSPMRPTPGAPAAPTGPQPQDVQGPASGSPAAATQADQVAMQQWQNQNAHPVMSSQDALGWMKNQTTLAQDATYLPMGGPGGAPAFAFHMKGGGQNIVPVSQMVQKGAGPLIAAQNTSQILSATDQQQGGPGAQGQPPAPQDQTQVATPPNISPPPPANLPQYPNISGPPPAPTGPPQAQAQPQYPNISGPPPAPVPGAYDPTPYRQGVAQAMANPQNLMAQEGQQAGTRTDISPVPPPKTDVTPLSDADKAVLTPEAIATARANAKPDPTKSTNAPNVDGSAGDPYMGELGPWHLYRDDRNRTGELYAVRSGISSLFKQQRMILGSDGWREYELPDSNMRIGAEGTLGGGKGAVSGGVMPNGVTFRGKNTFPTFSHEEIASMSVPQLQGWMDLAGKYYNTNGEPNSNMGNRLNLLMEMDRRTQRLLDGSDIIKKEGIPATAYGREAQTRSAEAEARNELEPPGGWAKGGLSPEGSWWDPGALFVNPAELASRAVYGYHELRSHGEAVNRFSDHLKEQVVKMNDAESQLPGPQMALQKPGQNEGPSVSLSGYGLSGTAKLGDGAGNARSPHREVNSLFDGNTPIDQAKADLISHKAEIDRQFEESYDDAVAHKFALTPGQVAYHHALKLGGGTVMDKASDNRLRDQNGNLTNPWSTTGNLPRIAKYDTSEFERLGIKKGDWYVGPDGVTKFQRTQ